MTKDELIKDYLKKLNYWKQLTQMTDAEIVKDDKLVEETKK